MNYWTEQSDEDLKQLIREKLQIKKDNPDFKTGYGLSQQQAEFLTSKIEYAEFFEGHIMSFLALDPEHKHFKEDDIHEVIQDNLKNLQNDKRMRKLIVEVWKEQNG